MKRDMALAISAHDHKFAAICCDKVYPLYGCESVPKGLCVMPTPAIIRQHPLVAFAQQLSVNTRDNLGECDATPFMNYLSWLQSEPGLYDPDFRLGNVRRFMDYMRNTVALFLAGSLAKSGTRALPILAADALPRATTARAALNKLGIAAQDADAIEINVENLAAVCADRAEWGQIEELRRDKHSIRSIRNLRLLFREEYADKAPDYIRDDIQRRIEEYQRAARKHGFALTRQAIKEVFNKDSLFGALLVSCLAKLAGRDTDIKAVGLIAAAVSLPSFVLSVAEKRWAFVQEQKEHPLAWIVEGVKQAGITAE